MSIEELPKRKVRYWCSRFKTELLRGVEATDAPPGLREHFEKHPDFIGWEFYNESKGWDVVVESPLEIRPLKYGATELWEKELLKNARPLPDEEAIAVMTSNKKAKAKKKKK